MFSKFIDDIPSKSGCKNGFSRLQLLTLCLLLCLHLMCGGTVMLTLSNEVSRILLFDLLGFL